MSRSRILRRALALAALTGVVLLGTAGSASAHVTVNPGEAASGGYAKLTFRIPNESDTAGTTAISVTFPTDTPLASVSVKPHAGWDVDVTRSTLPDPVETNGVDITEAVTDVTWTAQSGTRIGPGEFDEFDVSVGPLPEAESMSFPTEQTYDDGTVVAWDEPAEEGAEEPERPAPTLALTAATEDGHHGAEADTEADEAEAADSEVTVRAQDIAGDDTDTTARILGAAGLTVGVIGLGAAGLAVRAGRRRTGA